MAAKINWHRFGTELRHCHHSLCLLYVFIVPILVFFLQYGDAAKFILEITPLKCLYTLLRLCHAQRPSHTVKCDTDESHAGAHVVVMPMSQLIPTLSLTSCGRTD